MRKLDTQTLDGAARHYASEWMRVDRKSRSGKAFIGGPSYVLQDFYNFHFKDEFEYMEKAIKEWLGGRALASFEKAAKEKFKPREDKLLAALLKERLAIDPDGNHIEGVVGKIEVGRRFIGKKLFEVETLASIRARKEKGLPIHAPDRTDRVTQWVERWDWWPIYAGEGEERVAGRIREKIGVGPGADPLPESAVPLPLGANVTNISAEACIAGIDAIADRLDEGSTAATIRGRTGAQPADPDAAESGTLLFTLTCSDPAVNGGVDDTDGTCSATFAAITDDSSADATGTLGYCRFGATGTGADDHIDGNATTDGTGATDWNTLSIVSGSTVSMTSAVIGQSQGSTAT